MSNIIQCLIIDDEPVARDILEDHLNKISTFNIVACCKNALEAFKIINAKVSMLDLDCCDVGALEDVGLCLLSDWKPIPLTEEWRGRFQEDKDSEMYLTFVDGKYFAVIQVESCHDDYHNPEKD